MTSRELAILADIGQLKRTPPNDTEIDALVRSGEARLKDAGNPSLALETASISHTMLPTRWRSPRSAVTVTAPRTATSCSRRCRTRSVSRASVWRLLAKCHGLRNEAEYEGGVELDDRIVTDLIAATKVVRDGVRRQA